MSVFGTWNLTINTPMGRQDVVLTLTEQAGGAGGTTSSSAESGTLRDVVVDGEHVTTVQDITTPFPMTVTLDLTVDGDAVTGKAVSGPFPPAPVEGVRA